MGKSRVPVFLAATVAAALASVASAGTIAPELDVLLAQTPSQTPVSVIVHMASQAPIAEIDRTLRENGATRGQRHEGIVSALRLAAGAQSGLQSDLDVSIAAGHAAGYTAYWITNALVVLAEADEIRRVARRADVAWVEPNFTVELIAPTSMAERGGQRGIGVPPGIRAVRAPEVWHEFGIDGAGTLVANLDTGVDGNHPALAARWRGAGGAHPWQECWLDVLGTNTEFPTDSQMHGTHVMGTITGLGAATQDSVGVAPGARWIACNVIGEPAGAAFDNDVLTAYQWFMDPDGDPATVDDVPDVVQNSWRVHSGGGYTDCDPRWWSAIDNCEAAGVVTTWSAGNEGPAPRTIGSPADRATTLTNAFSVGAVDATHYNWPYPIASFSSRGPTECAVPPERSTKPEVVAPGVDVYSSVPGGGYQGGWSGTSMAGPHVAGVVALVRQANPDLDVASVKDILMRTARDLGSPGEENTHGWGFIDAYQAVVLATTGFGRFDGHVTNGSWQDAPLPGVKVALAGTEHVYRTDGEGHYAGAASPGLYLAVASLEGFRPDSAVVHLELGGSFEADFSLDDAAGPAITDVTSIVHAPRAGGYPVRARASDYSGVTEVRLVYRIRGQEWSSTNMSLIRDSGEYAAEVPGFPAGVTVDYYVEADDGAGWTATYPADAPESVITFVITEYLYQYAMEDPGDAAWTIGAPGDDATGGLWVRADPVGTYDLAGPFQPEDDHTPDPGVKCFVTGNGQPGGGIWENDVDGGCTTLTSPVFDLTGADAAFVNYHRWYVQDAQNNDNLDVRVSTNGGNTWTILELVGGSRAAWTRVSLRIDDFVPLTDRFRVRFRACDQLAPGNVEAAIDDFSIETFDADLAGLGGAPPQGGSALAQNEPNPTGSVTSIRFCLSNPGPARLTIFDVAGRRVRSLLDGRLAAGSHEVAWDGRDDHGVPAPSGVYFYRLESGTFRQGRRMSLVRP